MGMHAQRRWGEALAIFEKALTLPGTGLKRFRYAHTERMRGTWHAFPWTAHHISLSPNGRTSLQSRR